MIMVNFSDMHKQSRNGRLFILSGPSGVGKNTLIKRILSVMPELYFIPSITTREMRCGEKQGDPYIFVSREKFEDMIRNNELLEWEHIHDGSYYGPHLETYEYAVKNGFDIIKDFDVNGALKLKKIFGNDAILIFVNTSSMGQLRKRLCYRGDTEQSIELRMKRVCEEIKKSKFFDFIMKNDDLDLAVSELKKLIESKRG